jgi:hypothetical protein
MHREHHVTGPDLRHPRRDGMGQHRRPQQVQRPGIKP